MKELIVSGKVGSGEYLPTMRDLCARYRLPSETVGRALHHLEAEGLVRSEPRRGYRVLARANDPDRGCPLGLVFYEKDWDPFERKLMAALQQAATKLGRSVLAVSRGDGAPKELVAKFRSARAWGALLNVSDPRLFDQLKRDGIPAVLVGTWHERPDIDSVSQDGFAGAMAAAAHLAARGHRRIGWLGYALAGGAREIIERTLGAIGGLASLGLRLEPELRMEMPLEDSAAALECARRLLRAPNRPTGILALWQVPAAGLVRAAAEEGLVPGRDFEMVGWSDEESYESEYRPMFGGGPIAPAMTWSLTGMAQAAIARLEQRRAQPGLPPVRLRIPAGLRLPDEQAGAVLGNGGTRSVAGQDRGGAQS